jgi:hypothetical protein
MQKSVIRAITKAVRSTSCRAWNGLNQFQPFQLHPVGADVGKIVLRLLHQPAFGAAAEYLR